MFNLNRHASGSQWHHAYCENSGIALSILNWRSKSSSDKKYPHTRHDKHFIRSAFTRRNKKVVTSNCRQDTAVHHQSCKQQSVTLPPAGRCLNFGPIEKNIMFLGPQRAREGLVLSTALLALRGRRASRSDTRAASQTFERMHNTRSNGSKT